MSLCFWLFISFVIGYASGAAGQELVGFVLCRSHKRKKEDLK